VLTTRYAVARFGLPRRKHVTLGSFATKFLSSSARFFLAGSRGVQLSFAVFLKKALAGFVAVGT
jgi:hypothetical protein